MAERAVQLLTTKQAAHEYSISERTLYNWAYRGEGPPRVKYRGLVRYRRRELEAWLDENTTAPSNP